MLTLTNSPCRLGKLANNLEHHGDDDVTAFDVPVVTELTQDQLNALLDDKLFARRVYDTGGKGKPARPGDGFTKLKSLELIDSFEDVDVQLTVGKTDLDFSGCKLNKVTLDLCIAGSTECSFSIRLRPQTDKEILQLLHYQNREVQISTHGGKAVVNKRQQELPLGAESESAEAGGDAAEKATNGEKPPAKRKRRAPAEAAATD